MVLQGSPLTLNPTPYTKFSTTSKASKVFQRVVCSVWVELPGFRAQGAGFRILEGFS